MENAMWKDNVKRKGSTWKGRGVVWGTRSVTEAECSHGVEKMWLERYVEIWWGRALFAKLEFGFF